MPIFGFQFSVLNDPCRLVRQVKKFYG